MLKDDEADFQQICPISFMLASVRSLFGLSGQCRRTRDLYSSPSLSQTIGASYEIDAGHKDGADLVQ